MMNSPIYDKYALEFGADQADAILEAALSHNNSVHDNYGSDKFKWAILICIGYQCVEVYHESHGITVPIDVFKNWVLENADLGTHDGDCDYIALFTGIYNEYIPEEE